MKYLLAVLPLILVACGPSPAQQPSPKQETVEYIRPDKDGCVVASNAKLVAEHRVGPITNLVKDTMYWGNKGECTVNFDITVNEQSYHLEETVEGWEQLPSLCYYAIERARKNLLLEIGGTYKSQATIACRIEDKS